MNILHKIWVWVRWFLLAIPLGIFSYFTAWFFFPFAYLMRNWTFNPLWVYLDDTRYLMSGAFATDYMLWLRENGGLEETFWQQYKWCRSRNRMWNLVELIKPLQGSSVLVKSVSDDLILRGEKYNSYVWSSEQNHYVVRNTMAALKFINKDGYQGWNVNQGKFISRKYSIFGKAFLYYYTKDKYSGIKRHYFKYSSVKKVRLLFWDIWITVKMGTNVHRYVSTLKFNLHKKIV